MLLVNPHLTPSPATWHTPCLSTSHPPSAPSHTKHKKHVLRDMFIMSSGSLTTPFKLNIKNTPTWACFRHLAAYSCHPSHWTWKIHPSGCVFHVWCLLLHLAPHTELLKCAHCSTFFMFSVLLSLTPPAKHQKHALGSVFFVFRFSSPCPSCWTLNHTFF